MLIACGAGLGLFLPGIFSFFDDFVLLNDCGFFSTRYHGFEIGHKLAWDFITIPRITCCLFSSFYYQLYFFVNIFSFDSIGILVCLYLTITPVELLVTASTEGF